MRGLRLRIHHRLFGVVLSVGPGAALPFYGFVQDISVGGVFRGECAGFVLYAKHHKRFCTVVADGAPACRSHPYHAALGNGKCLSVYLKFSFSVQEEIKFLVGVVAVKESGFRSRQEHLE